MKLRTEKRLYRVEPMHDDNMNIIAWDATFQPLNPKTGNPWQASRGVPGWNAHLRGVRGGVTLVMGNPPPFEQWGKEVVSCRRAYATERDAVKAIKEYDSTAATAIVT